MPTTDNMQSNKLSRNDRCPCGSGKKVKNCCQHDSSTKSTPLNSVAFIQAIKAAWMYFETGEIERSLAICHQIIQSLPKQPDAYHLLGVIALKDGNIELAIKYFYKALAFIKNNPVLYNNLGLAFHEAGELKDAENNYRKAIAINPRYAHAYYNLHALLLKKDITQAIYCLRQLLVIDPRDLDAKAHLGILLEYVGESEAAQSLWGSLDASSNHIKARLEAWRYLSLKWSKKPAILGSNVETFKLALNAAKLKGLILEFGVRHGNTLRQIAKLAGQEVHGFDSFQGLPEVWHHEPKGSYTTRGEIPVMPRNAKLHVGWFDSILPAFLTENDQVVRLVNIDCDIYSSTKTVLDLLSPRITAGSVLIFDEYIGNEHWREDEFKAFQEAVVEYKWNYEYLSFSFFTKQVVVRITNP